MPVNTEASGMEEQNKLRRPRSQFIQPILKTDPNPLPQIPSIIQSTRSKPTISSFLVSSNPTTANETHYRKRNNFSSATFRGLGCTASASRQVSVPAAIRTSADWQGKKTRERKQKKNSKNKNHQGISDGSNSNFTSGSCLDVQDVWCGPGIGFTADAAASVDCVVARRNVSGRGKIDGEKRNQRERSCFARGIASPDSETISFLDSDLDLEPIRASNVFGTRYYRHVRHPSPEGIAEIMMFQSSLMMGGRFDSHDRFRDWRLDVDNMSYEELLELGDRIGYVSTGLKEDEIGNYVRKMKLSIMNEMSHLTKQVDRKCTICQEEYETNDEMGKLDCGHSYHVQCIKQWLTQKNACPVCKKTVAVQRKLCQ